MVGRQGVPQGIRDQFRHDETDVVETFAEIPLVESAAGELPGLAHRFVAGGEGAGGGVGHGRGIQRWKALP
ncbi:hypothetical protein GCM10020256_33190 [Streptomyces thermocoprophilus]